MTKTSPTLREYEIQSVLGSGACGLVYLARDRAGEQCAIKEFTIEPSIAQQFFREVSMVFSLNHPNIVKCRNLIYTGGTKNYLIFEYINGGTLRDHLYEQTSLPVPQALELMRQLLLGLHHAHERGIVHRDLKPENVLIVRDEERLEFKIADLGVARFQSEALKDHASTGSPAYMAPEQYYGEFSVASDLYSIGVMFYEALAGQRPFEGAYSLLFLLHAQQAPDLSPISHEGIRRLVGCLLAKQPGQRPASAAAVLAEVEALIAGPNVHLPEPEAADEEEARSEPRNDPDPETRLAIRQVLIDREMSGAQRLFPLQTAHHSRLLVSDAIGSDLFDLGASRLRPRFLSEPTCAVAPACADARQLYFATNQYIRLFDAETCTVRILFPHQTSVHALAADPANRRFFYASYRKVFCSDFSGGLLWQTACDNYSCPPCLVGDGRGGVVFTTGPAMPSLVECDAEGKIVRQHSLDAPVLAMRQEQAPGSYSAILLGLGADAPCKLISFADGKSVREAELGIGIHHAVWHGPLLALHFTDGRVELRSPSLAVVCTYRSAGAVLDDRWLPGVSTWVFLERIKNRVWFRALALESATVATSSDSAASASSLPSQAA